MTAPGIDDAVGRAVGRAVELAGDLQEAADRRRGRRERARAARLARMLEDPAGMSLVVALTDEVLRVREPRRAARVLAGFGAERRWSNALGPVDRAALAAGTAVATLAPRLVVGAVRQRVLFEMGDVVLPAGGGRVTLHAARRRLQGIRVNVNLLGEAVLGEDEAERRLQRLVDLMGHALVDHVSVKVSSICSQLDVLRFDHEVDRIAARLRPLLSAAAGLRPPRFVNLDMEEYRDLELTLAVFRKVLDEEEFEGMGAGVALQAYLPDSLPALEELCRWARTRHHRSGGWVKVRIVKGANLAMERVEAEMRGWPQAPFETKADTDANYKRMLEVALDPANEGAVRVGVATHNVFELAWAITRATELGGRGRLEPEMLEGMSPAASLAVATLVRSLRLYAPVVERDELDSAIAYLLRRLDENSSPDNFLSQQFSMHTRSPAWNRQEQLFRASVASAAAAAIVHSRRIQDRSTEEPTDASVFYNEPDTDFTRAANRSWVAAALDARRRDGDGLSYHPVVAGRELRGAASETGVDPSAPGEPAYRWEPASVEAVEEAVATAGQAGAEWAGAAASDRRAVLLEAGAALARARGRLIAAMAFDTGKTVREGDPEVSEAIDFARYYAGHLPGDGFRPHRTVVVASPWNFPLSIPAGGVLAALAAGSAVILKPAPEAVAVGAELVRVLWEAGVPRSVLQFVPCTDGDASRRLVTHDHVDAVVLTGSWETTRMFLRWRPRLALHGETSGKNAIVVMATADMDEAITDVVRSAFGHAGQKCSAASLAIVESSVLSDGRFQRRLADAVRSLRVGPAWDLRSVVGPLICPPEGPLLDAFSRLEAGEVWLVRPERLDEHGYLWSPGVKVGVEPGSPFHLTECFGPVLGLMGAEDLEEAVRLQNQPSFGLTAGLAALDPAEIEWWRDAVEAGNLYVNRTITGAIVRRQPFGGWKHSVVGPGAKAGGANYVASLGEWPAFNPGSVSQHAYAASCRQAWTQMKHPIDESGLASESNAFRYRPLGSVLIVRGDGCTDEEVSCAMEAAAVVGAHAEVGRLDGSPENGNAENGRGGTARWDKVRFLGEVGDEARLAAVEAGLWTDAARVAADPAKELLRWVREQAVSETLHRHGNLSPRRPGLVRR